MAQVIIIFGLSMFKPATNIDAAAKLSPKMRTLLGVGAKYGFHFTLIFFSLRPLLIRLLLK